ncbi:MAG: hypothetical protein AB1476_00500 [Candidatus Hadarchaeota archaeon]
MNKAFQSFHNLNYLEKFDVALVNVSPTTFKDMANLVVEAKKLGKKPIIVGVIDGEFGNVRTALQRSDNFKYFKMFLDNCDVFMTYYIHKKISDYLKFYTDTPTVHFPQLYPFGLAKSFYRPVEKKKKIIFVPGHPRALVDNFFSLLAAKKIQTDYPEFLIEAIKIPSFNEAPLKGAKYRLIQSTKYEDYLKHTGETYMIIDMDVSWTWGRVAADAAAVGTPCIGLNSGAQARLFPDLTCSDITGAKKVIELAERLIEDKKFYAMVQKKAFKKLGEYSLENYEKYWQRVLEAAHK